MEESADPLSTARGMLTGFFLGAFCWSLAVIIWLVLRLINANHAFLR
jgi:hypothetical protein